MSKFMVEAIDAQPDFTTATWTMDSLASGTADILTDSSNSLGTVFSAVVVLTTQANQSVTYLSGPGYISDVYYPTLSQVFSINANVSAQLIPDLPCSSSGSTSIQYSASSYNGGIVPSWVSVNSSTGSISVAAPNLSVTTNFTFYLSSAVSGVSSSIDKIITISVLCC